MTPAGHTEFSTEELDAIAWEFLGSEFTEPHLCRVADRPPLRRLPAHQGRDDLVNDGAAYDALLQQVMANIGPARASRAADSQTN